MSLLRIPLHGDRCPPLELAPDETARISLAWWDGDEPVVVRGPRGACTVVLRWPTDPAGRVDRAGEVVARRWDLRADEFAGLRWLLDRFPLREHDLHVSGAGSVRPRWRTLRHGDWGVDLDALVRRAIGLVEAECQRAA